MRFRNDNDSSTSFYFNPSTCVIFLSSRFLLHAPSTETTRMKLLARILDPRDVKSIQRMVVTYAPDAKYERERIGPAFRAFVGLRDWYIAWRDSWGGGDVGGDVGAVAERIKGCVERVEEDETDDDEESEGEKGVRLEMRRERRIVGVELRIGEVGRGD